jgi:hypothetical protein
VQLLIERADNLVPDVRERVCRFRVRLVRSWWYGSSAILANNIYEIYMRSGEKRFKIDLNIDSEW